MGIAMISYGSAGLLLLAGATIAPLYAQTYPNRPVRLIVVFAPGGAADIIGRIIAAQLTEQAGEQFVVDKLSKDLASIAATAETKKRLLDQGAEVDYLGPAEFGPFVAAETAKWARVVSQGNIKAQ